MELVVAPVDQLRRQIARIFEETVARTIAPPADTVAEPPSAPAHSESLRPGKLGATDDGEAAPSRFACGLTGGSTALIFLGALGAAAVNWPRITLYWGDERAVPPDHPDSNYGLAERLLLSPLGPRAPRALRMPAEMRDLDEAARDYDAVLPLGLDLLILGTGEDGHVCSLFPGHRALMVEDARVIAIEDAPKPPPRRLTITLPYVLRARHLWIVAVGPRKRPVLQAAISGHQLATPLDLVIQQARDVTVFTDQRMRRGFVAV